MVVFPGWNTQLSVTLPSVIHAEYFLLGIGRSDSAFTQVGFRDWKHAMGKHGIQLTTDVLITSKQLLAGMITLPTSKGIPQLHTDWKQLINK